MCNIGSFAPNGLALYPEERELMCEGKTYEQARAIIVQRANQPTPSPANNATLWGNIAQFAASVVSTAPQFFPGARENNLAIAQANADTAAAQAQAAALAAQQQKDKNMIYIVVALLVLALVYFMTQKK